MPVYSRQVRVAAPLERVWEFHSRVEGLEALTPDWMNLRVERVVGPGGDPDPRVLAAGSEVQLSIRPLGVGPRRRWVSRILQRERGDGTAYFRDRMVDGPFRKWVHTHRFFGDGGETVVSDRVDYELPFGAVGRALGPVAVVGFEPMFRTRHRKTKAILEG